MEGHGIEHKPGGIQVILASTQYVLTEGGSVDIDVLLANSGPSDFFIVNLLGIPPGWIDTSGPSAIWVATGVQERIVLTVRPPVDEGVVGSYPGRLYVFRQSAPEQGRELPIVLLIQPEERQQKAFRMRIETEEMGAAPGSTLKIPLMISSSSPRTEFLEISVEGVPAAWVSLASPVVTLLAGEGKVVDLFLHVPAGSAEMRAGYYPLKVTLASQKDPSLKEEAEIRLTVAAFESQGLVGVLLNFVQFAAAPGDSLTIPVTLLNRGLVPATFTLGVEGIPAGWVSTATPALVLKPGESREVNLLIDPPLSPASQAGRHDFHIVVMSQEAPDQVVRVGCSLALAGYTRFSTSLEPQRAEAEEPIRVVVRNEGNTHQAFQLALASTGNQLVFEFLEPEGAARVPAVPDGTVPSIVPSAVPVTGGVPAAGPAGDPSILYIPPGDAGVFRFTARPRQSPWMSGAATYPYQITVSAGHQQSPVLPGAVTARGLVPVWVLAVFLILCLWFSFSAAVALFGTRYRSNTVTQTAAAWTQQAVGATQTIVANQTAAALVGPQDTDGDGLPDQQEVELQTDPNQPDTDQDSLVDGMESLQYRTNPLVPDTDGDGLKDGDEVRLQTDPLIPDSDGDGSSDGNEAFLTTDPLNPDSDNDGLPDGLETSSCPGPLNPDSDEDGLTDSQDVSPCDAGNPVLTAIGVAVQPTSASTTLPPPLTPSPPAAPLPTQTSALFPAAPPFQQMVSFTGSILFESNRDGNSEIYAMEASGQTRRITNHTAADAQAVWDPAMRRIAFTSSRDGQNEIYVMNADGSSLLNLTNNPADDHEPAWSGDGQWILFTSNRSGNYDIYAVQVDNLETRNLTNSPGNDTQPVWIRSRAGDLAGEYLLFTSDRDGNPEIYRMKSDGTGAINLTLNPAADQMARGSPDGSLVAFTSDRSGNQDIFTMRLDGQNLTNVTSNPASDFGPVWSSDQVWLAFTSDRSGNREVFITKPGLTDLYNVSNSPSSQEQVTDWR